MGKKTKAFFRVSNMLRIVLTMLCVMFVAGIIHAETITVTGTVTSVSDGEPLIGVSVTVGGSNLGATTDIDGHYSIRADVGATLHFSYVGMTPYEAKVTGPVLDVAMNDNTSALEELVVVGYGVQKKKLVTGATSQIKGDAVSKMNTTNALQAMQGQAAGINITQSSGQPGKGMKVSIRGLGTIGNSEPLYLIDGVGGDISNINPADIESIDILKDAASAAIYGAQAANGVVLVTTKSGKEGRSVVSFDGYIGWQTVARKTKMLNAQEYMMIMDEQAVNSGDMPYDWSSYKSIYDANGNINDTNWLDLMLNDNALTQNYSMSVSGGNAKSNYSISGGYTSADGIVGGNAVSNFSRYNFRVNSQYKLFDDYITVGEHLTYVYTKSRAMNDTGNGNNGNLLYGAFNSSPLAPVFGDNKYDSPYNSTANSDWNAGDGNPYGSMMTLKDKKSHTGNFNADVFAQVEPIKDLVIKTVLAVNLGNSSYRSYTPKYQFDGYADHTRDYVNQSASDWYSLTWQNTASYRFNVKENEFNALLGMEVNRSEGINLSGQNASLSAGFQNWDKAYVNNGTSNSTADGMNVSGNPNPSTRNLSYFARLGWNYKERYMINATVRADGSSKFAKGHRWGYFPSVSAGWNISNESFMEGAFDNKLTFLKLRASWGRVGNNNIDAFQYLAPIIYEGHYTFGDGASGSTAPGYLLGAFMERLANEDIKWETSEQFNVGLDTRWFNSRLNFNFDFYIKNTKDWLVMAPILYTAGFGDNGPMINGGNVKNTGVELNLTWNDKIGEVEYYVGANGAWNRNRVGEIPNKDGLIQGGKGILYNNCDYWYRAENGHSIGYFWGLQTDGLFQNQKEINDWIAAGNGVSQSNPKPGDVRFVDQNHDGVIDEHDRVDLGCGIPDWTFGFNFGFSWKNFDFGAVFSGMAGNKIVKSYRGVDGHMNNYDSSILGRWTGEGTSNRVPRVSNGTDNYLFSDLFIQDGDFLRISNVTVGYDFAPLINWKYISKARLYFQVQNLYTFTNYDGMDPEIGNGDVNNSWVRGVDQGFYPRPRTFLCGVNITF